MKTCPQCGEETETLHEGYCYPCKTENLLRLTEHNEQFSYWESLSDAQRDEHIKRSMS